MRDHGPRSPRPEGTGYATQLLKLIPWTIVLPAMMIFFTELNGSNLQEAFQRSAYILFSTRTAPMVWPLLLFSYLILILYLHPATLCAHATGACVERGRTVLKRLDRLPFFVVGVSIAMFLFGALMATMESQQAAFFDSPKSFLAVQAVSSGLMLGVLVSLNVENVLFPIRRAVLQANPELVPRRTSLYGRIALILAAVAVFVVFQVFSIAEPFYLLGQQNPAAAAPLDRGIQELPMPDPHSAGLRNVLTVFSFRMAIFLLILLELLWQIKLMLKKPLAIIKDRLLALNSADAAGGRPIQVINNDEFAEIYRQVNGLIAAKTKEATVSRERFDSVAGNAADPIITYDSALAIEAFNPAAEEYFGYAASEVVGRKITDIISFTSEEAECRGELEALYPGIAMGGKGDFRRFNGKSKDGLTLCFEAHTSRTECEGEASYTVILRDLSHQIEFEESLRKAKQAAERANRLKSEFLANMSHELRTPLNAVLGFTQLLAPDRNLTPGQVEKLDIITRSGEHLLALINDILDISKIEAGKVEMHGVPFDLGRFVEDLREMFELRCRKKGLSLYVERVGELPRYVEGDLGKLRQVLINLVGNAVKFTAEGGVGIAVGVEGGLVRFSITDSGKGIPADELELILQPFSQSSLTDNEGGTGLGLAISSRFIEMMGGKLEIRSEVGRGSSFSFALPLPESARRPEERPASEGVPVALKPGSSATALIVDDKETNRLVLKEMLEAAGFGTLEAADGREAVKIALERAPDVVFMDIKMPEMDGFQAVEELRRSEAGRKLKVFALTASAFKHDEERIAASGFDGFLAKPFKRSALFQLIKEKTAVELEYEGGAPAPRDAGPIDPAELDVAAAAAALGPGGLERLSGFAAIGDFAGARALADSVRGAAPALARLVAGYASVFDEEGLGALVARLKDAGGRS